MPTQLRLVADNSTVNDGEQPARAAEADLESDDAARSRLRPRFAWVPPPALTGIRGRLRGLSRSLTALATRSSSVPQGRGRLDDERGAVTAEYAIVIMAAVAFAGLLVAIMRSGEVRQMLVDLVQNALGSAG